jgi:hypothetical protein
MENNIIGCIGGNMTEHVAKCVECGKEIGFDIFPILMKCRCGCILPMKLTKVNGKSLVECGESGC